MWGDGTTSSSDGQFFHAGGRGEAIGDVNARHGNEPGVAFYTHISDQFGPFHTKVIAATASEAPHVLDGLLYHQTGLQIVEHYTDTGGATDHVFGLCALLGFRFAPRLRDIKDRRLYVLPGQAVPASAAAAHWRSGQCRSHRGALGRAAAHGDLHPRRYGSGVGNARAPRRVSTPERARDRAARGGTHRAHTLRLKLSWMRDIDLRRRVGLGLNKGEARNALARAVFFHRLGELRDRSFESQAYRASGLNLLVAAIILWNTKYLENTLDALRAEGQRIPKELACHLAPLGWEHVSLTGDYTWSSSDQPQHGHLRPLRRLPSLLAA